MQLGSDVGVQHGRGAVAESGEGEEAGAEVGAEAEGMVGGERGGGAVTEERSGGNEGDQRRDSVQKREEEVPMRGGKGEKGQRDRME